MLESCCRILKSVSTVPSSIFSCLLNRTDLKVRPNENLRLLTALTQVGFTAVDVLVEGGDPTCTSSISSRSVACDGQRTYQSHDDTVHIDGLYPGERLRCSVTIEYADGLGSSQPTSFVVDSRLLPTSMVLFAGKNSIKPGLPNRLKMEDFVRVTGRICENINNRIDCQDPKYMQQIFRDGFIGLKPYTEYNFCMKVNCQTKECEKCYRQRTLATEPEDAPTNLAVLDASSSTLRVRWTEVSEEVGEFRSYEIKTTKLCFLQLQPQGCSCENRTQYFTTTSKEYADILGLEAYSLYKVQVRLNNHVGPGPWSSPITSHTLARVWDISQQDLTLSPAATNVTITLKPPCPYPGPQRLTFFKGNRRSDPELEIDYNLEETPPRSELTVTLDDGYFPNRKYNIFVTVQSLPGRGSNCSHHCSTEVGAQVSTPISRPLSPPTNIQADEITSSGFGLSWAGPETKYWGTPSVQYEISLEKQCLWSGIFCLIVYSSIMIQLLCRL